MQAIREWRQALDDGLKDAELCFRYALAAEDAGASPSDVRAALLRAIALRPAFDDARFKLGLLESNTGNYRAAVEQFHAMRVPTSSRAFGYWAILAYALTELGNRDEALAAGRKALSEAATEEERQRARRLAYVASTDMKTQFVQDSEGRTTMVTTRVEHGATDFNPFIEPSDRMHRSKGQLTEVLCDAGQLTGFRVVTTDGPLVLNVPDPFHVQIKGGPNEFLCGEASPRDVQVDYALVERTGESILRGMTFEDEPGLRSQ